MTARLCCATLLCLSFAVCAPTRAQAALFLEISPGPAPNQTTWTFSGETETGFGFFNNHGQVNENEPSSMWGDFPPFTTLDNTHLTKVSGTANIVKNGTITRAIGNAWVDDGTDNTAPDREATGDAIGVILPGGDIGVAEGDTLSWSGSLVMGGADISAFSAGGLPYTGDSTRFYNEGNNIPMTLTIVGVPEPSTCLLSFAPLAILALRRLRS